MIRGAPVYRRLLAIIAGFVIAASPSASLALTHKYAGQASTTTHVVGIDGYIRTSGTIMVDGDNDFHANFLNLCSSGSCADWVQVGEFQGTIGVDPCPGSACVRSIAVVHMYWENYLGTCDYYDIADLGTPPTPNYAFYISYVNWSLSPCFQNQGKYAFRIGSVTNPPSGYGWMTTSNGIPIAETEVYPSEAGEPLNQDRFGLNHSNQVNPSYQLHVKVGGSWLQWNAANVPGTGTFGNNPPFYYSVVQYAAFRTDDQ